MLNHSDRIDTIFQALGEPVRRGMITRLAAGPASVSQIAEPLEMSLPAVMQHIAVLEASGLVRTQKIGRVRTCTLAPDALKLAQEWISEQRAMWERRLDQLGRYLDETDPDLR